MLLIALVSLILLLPDVLQLLLVDAPGQEPYHVEKLQSVFVFLLEDRHRGLDA